MIEQILKMGIFTFGDYFRMMAINHVETINGIILTY